MTNNEIDIIGKKYYLYIDTSNIVGKIERLVADMLNINSYKHVISKRYFEKYLYFKLSDYIVYEKFIENSWVEN